MPLAIPAMMSFFFMMAIGMPGYKRLKYGVFGVAGTIYDVYDKNS